MADDNAVVIKIAADVASATASLDAIVKAMGELITATKGVGTAIESMGTKVSNSTKKGKKDTDDFFTSFFKGAGTTEAAAVAMGTQLSKAFDTLKEGVKNAITSFPDMIKHVAEAGDEMLTMSNRIGVSVGDLGELKYIAGQSGASMEGMARTIQSLGGILEETGPKGDKARDAIKSIGLNIADLKKEDPKAAFLDIVKAIQTTVPAADQGRVAMEIFGNKFRNNTMLLKEDIGKLQEKFQELGGGMSEDLAKAGDEYSDNMKNIQQVQENFRNQIASAVLPAVNGLLEAFPKLGGFALTLGSQLWDLGKAMAPMIINLGLMKGGFLTAAGATDIFNASIKALGVAIDFLAANPMVALVTVLGLLAGAIFLIGQRESETEKKIRENTLAWMDQTKTLREAMNTYTLLSGKAGLNAEQTKALADATSMLAKASGLTVEEFKKEESAGSKVTDVIRERIKSETELENKQIERARLAAEEAKKELARVTALRTQIVERKEPEAGMGLHQSAAMRAAHAQAILAQTDTETWLGTADELAEKIKELTKKSEDADKALKAMTEHGVAAAASVTPKDEANAKILAVQAALKSLTAEQKQQIQTADALHISTSDLATAFAKNAKDAEGNAIELKDMQSAVETVKKNFDDAKRAAEQMPFAKLQKSAQEFNTELKAAQAAGRPTVQIIEELGKKAADLSKGFQMHGKLDELGGDIQALGADWNASQIDEKTKDLNKSLVELGTTFKTSTEGGARAAAAAVKAMNDEIASSTMTAEQVQLAAIEKERVAHHEAIAQKSREQEAALTTDVEKIRENFDKKLKIEQDFAGASGVVSQERMTALTTERDEAIQAAKDQAAGVQLALASEGLTADELAKHKKDLQNKTTADHELNLKLWGVQTETAAKEEIATEEKKLAEMKAANNSFYAAQIIALQAMITAQKRALTEVEKMAAAHGIKTKAQLKEEADAQQVWLDYMLAHYQDFTQEEIDAETDKLQKMREAQEDGENAWAKAHGVKTSQQLAEERTKLEVTLTHMKNNRKSYTDDAIRQQERLVASAYKSADLEGQAYAKMGDSITKTFASVSQFGGDYMKTLSKSMGQANEAGKSMRSGWKDMTAKGASKEDKINAGMGMAQAGIEGVMAIKEATNTLSTKKNVLGGAMAGAKMGQGIAGPWGAAVGAGVGAIVGAFRNKGAMKAAKQAASDFGAEIPIELAQSIDKEAKKRFKGDRLPAELLHMGDMITAAGGITDKNVGLMQKRMTDTLNLTRSGKLTTEETTKVMSDSFGAFAKHVLDSGKLADKGFTDMMKQAKELKVSTKDMSDFVASQVDRLGNAFATMVAPMAKESSDIGGKVADQLKNLEDAKRGARDDDEESQKALADESQKYDDLIAKQKAMGEDALPKINRAARLMTASFNEAVSSGMSMTEAVDRMGPGLDSLIQSTKDYGMTVQDTGAGFLASFRDRVNANREMVDSASSLNDIMLAMSNIGALNADTFLDLQAQGLDTYDQLDKAGFEQNEILSQMKPFLEQARDAHENLKLPIDENTEALIKQAEEHGVLKKQAVDTNTVLMEGFGALIEAVGGKLPEAFKKMKEAALEASQKAAAGMKGVDGAATGVQDSLADTDWQGWSADAVAAATEAQKAVDGVSLGHSPGGLKEIPIQIEKSLKAFSLFERFGVKSAKSVQAAVEDIRPDTAKAGEASTPTEAMAVVKAVEESVKASAEAMTQMQDAVVPMTEAVQAMQPIADDVKSSIDAGQSQDAIMQAQKALQMATYEQERQRQEAAAPTQNITLAIDRPILKDRESIMDLTKEVSKHLRQALGNTGAWMKHLF